MVIFDVMKLRKKKGYKLRKYQQGGDIPGVNNVRDLLDALTYDIRPSTLPDMSGDPELDRRIAQQTVAESTAGPRIAPPTAAPERLQPLPPPPIGRSEGEIRPLPDPPERNLLQRVLGYGATMAANPMGALKYALDPSTTPLLETTLENYRDDMRGMHTPMGSVIGMNPYSFRSFLGEQAHEKQLGRPNVYDYLVQSDPLGLIGMVAGRGRLNLNRGMPVLNQVTGEVDFGTQTLFPNRLTQSILNRRRSGAAASEEAAAAEEAFLAEGMGEATIARGPGASGSTSIPKRQPSDIYGELGQQLEKPSWRMLRNQPNLTARDALRDTDINQVMYDEQGNRLQGEAATQAIEKYKASNRYRTNVLEAHKKLYQYEGNVRQLPSLMHGSKLENSVGKDGTIQVKQVQALIDKGQLSGPEAQNLQEALDLSVKDVADYTGQATVDRVDYRVLKRNAEALADPFDLVRKPTVVRDDSYTGETYIHQDSYQGYGVDNLFLPTPGMIGRGENYKTIDHGPEMDEIMMTTRTNLITTDVPELRNTERGHFGKEVTGHYRTFRMPGEPDVLYISEMQADPLQARKEEYTLPTGEEIQTRQLSVVGGRRYDDKFRKFQQENAVEVHNGLADMNNQISVYLPRLLDETPSVTTLNNRVSAINQIIDMWDKLNRGPFEQYDGRMQEQMAEQGGISGFKKIEGSYRPTSMNLFGKPENRELRTIANQAVDIKGDLDDIRTFYQQMEAYRLGVSDVPLDPSVQAAVEAKNESIAQDISDLQQMIRDVQDNVMLFGETLEAGYNGKLTPLQAKMVKDQDKFLVGKILQAEADGASVIRFPRGETVRKIQGYDTVDEAITENLESQQGYMDDARDTKMFIEDHDLNVLQWTPEGQNNTLYSMEPEEFVEWYKNFKIEQRIGDARGLRDQRRLSLMNKTNVEKKLAKLEAEALDEGIAFIDDGGRVKVNDEDKLLGLFHKYELLSRSTNRGLAVSILEGDAAAKDHMILMAGNSIFDMLSQLEGQYEQYLQAVEHGNMLQNQGGDEEMLAQQAIMDGYERMTKAFDKHKLTYREVMDEYGNGWYEVDVPANFNAKAGEVRAYRIGGRVPMKLKKKKAFNLVKQ